MEDPKYLRFNGAKNFHKVTSLGELRGHPCKNQTKMKFLWQGSKTQIVSISTHK